ncbi:MAG: acyltransferase [Proteobacteria bacterium]|nr:acyltransferase [Pseudomonadota bacterium]
MPRPFSVYLDLVRFIAACLVYLYHSNQRWLVQPLLPAHHYGHTAVIVFFVLSGYVIAYVTATKENDWRTYAASRLSRIYSVAVPAVILTLALDGAGRLIDPAPYGYPYDWIPLRVATSWLMLNEAWFVSITSFSNVPYWSICYESWYYVAFGALVFLPRRRAFAVIGALLLLLGPKVAMLAPIWAMGVALYRSKRLAAISERLGWALVAGSVAGIACYLALDVEAQAGAWFKRVVGDRWYEQFTFSRFFAGDYLLGLLIMLHFVGVRRIADRIAPLMRAIEPPVKRAASYTFTLYLLHQPLFLFWGVVVHGDNKGYGSWALTTVLMAVSVVAIGALTETRRRGLTQWIRAALRRIGADRAGLTARRA